MFIAVIFPFAMAFAQQSEKPPARYARERTYDVLHYKLNIRLDERAKQISGDVAITLVPLRSALEEIVLDAAELTIDRINLGKLNLRFFEEGEKLHVTLGKPAHLTDTLILKVQYHGTPQKGLYFVQPDSGYPDRPWQVWSQGESEDNHYWFPCYDYPNDKATSEMIVTVNDRFTAVSNGKLLRITRDSGNKTRTFHWSEPQPHSSYLISVVAGEYVELKDAWNGIPFSYYVYPRDSAIVRFSFSKTPMMMKLFSEKIGFRYPWEKYSQTVVSEFIYGGMENVSATTLTDITIHDDRAHLDNSSDGLVSHELAHQWWGDLLTCRDWSHAWLNEGFATYFAHVFEEADSGWAYAAYHILGDQTSVLDADVGNARRPTVTNRYIASEDIFDNRIYAKGACILHMLRYELGDELFWKAINHYARKYAYQNVETNDFQVAVEEATGYEVHQFFDQWVYGAGYPEFQVSIGWDEKNQSLHINVRQMQVLRDSTDRVFVTPVDIQVWTQGNARTERMMISNREEDFTLHADAKPELVIFDAGHRLLAKTHYEKETSEWMYQLEHAAPIDRVIAAKELKSKANDMKVVSVLGSALLGDTFWPVRVEAARSLGSSDSSSAAALLLRGYGDGRPRVREVAVAGLEKFRTEEVRSLLKKAFREDPSYAVAAAALKALASNDSAEGRAYCKEGLRRSSHRDVIRITALKALAEKADSVALEIVKEHTRYGIYRDTRAESVRILARVWNHFEDVADYLVTLLNDPSFHVRRVVIESLGTMPALHAVEDLRRSAGEEPDARLRKAARDSIAKILKIQQISTH